ncbi:hypothetical protein PAHAL_9G461100 [Panicum hallii]|uniref:Uncharacterized protein n=1 Tax=Panicum hallii TaxID=206008 RepID=A0A2T8I4T6_9POAL|nr:hypothetical protein PAHAL_9G461100 [Panicum hallii]
MARWWNPRNAVLFSPNVNEECFKGSMLLKMDSKISIHRDAKARQRCHAKQNQDGSKLVKTHHSSGKRSQFRGEHWPVI